MQHIQIYCSRGIISVCTTEQAACGNELQDRQNLVFTAEQAAGWNILQNFQLIKISCKTGIIFECPSEQAAKQNVLHNRQHI